MIMLPWRDPYHLEPIGQPNGHFLWLLQKRKFPNSRGPQLERHLNNKELPTIHPLEQLADHYHEWWSNQSLFLISLTRCFAVCTRAAFWALADGSDVRMAFPPKATTILRWFILILFPPSCKEIAYIFDFQTGDRVTIESGPQTWWLHWPFKLHTWYKWIT